MLLILPKIYFWTIVFLLKLTWKVTQALKSFLFKKKKKRVYLPTYLNWYRTLKKTHLKSQRRKEVWGHPAVLAILSVSLYHWTCLLFFHISYVWKARINTAWRAYCPQNIQTAQLSSSLQLRFVLLYNLICQKVYLISKMFKFCT